MAKSKILDRSGNYLEIFMRNPFEIDRSLPKWKLALNEVPKEDIVGLVSFETYLKGPFNDFNIYVGKKIIDNFRNDRYLTANNSGENHVESEPKKESLLKRMLHAISFKSQIPEEIDLNSLLPK